MKCWNWNGKCLKKSPEGFYGFVYLITNLKDKRIYVGKKAFSYRKRKKLSKKARIGTRKRVSIEQIDSQWLSYYGSSLELKEDVKRLGEKNFKREILHLCESKADMNYMELKEQMSSEHEVMKMGIGSYNKWISIKYFKR